MNEAVTRVWLWSELQMQPPVTGNNADQQKGVFMPRGLSKDTQENRLQDLL